MAGNTYNILDFYRNIIGADKLAQRNMHRVYFETVRGAPSKVSTITQNSCDDFNLRIEYIEFPEATSVDTEEVGSIFIKTKRPKDTIDFGTTLKIAFQDVKDSPLDDYLDDWSRMVTAADKWVAGSDGKSVPYPTATLVIEFTRCIKTGDTAFQTYKFYGAYPTRINFPTVTKSPETIVGDSRIAEFEYSFYTVTKPV